MHIEQHRESGMPKCVIGNRESIIVDRESGIDNLKRELGINILGRESGIDLKSK